MLDGITFSRSVIFPFCFTVREEFSADRTVRESLNITKFEYLDHFIITKLEN